MLDAQRRVIETRDLKAWLCHIEEDEGMLGRALLLQ